MKIVFFGASVTEQNKNQKGEITGYFPYVEYLFKKTFGDKYTLLQKGFGSGHLNDTGFIYLELIKRLKPDMVVLEWYTTSCTFFDKDKFHHIQKSLLDLNVRVVNLILPKKNALTRELDNIKQARAYQKLGSYFVSLYPYVDNPLDLSKCLRDNVHTTPEGGKAYAEIIFDEIIGIIKGNYKNNEGEIIPIPKTYSVPVVNHKDIKLELNSGNKLIIEMESLSESNECQLFSKVKLGRFSPVLDYKSVNGISDSIEVWDIWSHFERPCLKPISNNFTLNGYDKITFEISNTSPNYNACLRPIEPVDLQNRKLPIIGEIFIIGGKILDVNLDITSSVLNHS